MLEKVSRRGPAERKFKRVLADARRESLIEATIASVSQYGNEGTSVRRIAAQAGVSPGLINHHFENLEELISLAYERLSQRWIDVVTRCVDAAGSEPGPRIEAFCAICICPDGENKKMIEAWMVFWAAILSSPLQRKSQSLVWIYYRQEIGRDLTLLAEKKGVKNLNIERATLGLLAIVDGLWIEKSLNPDSFTPEVAIRICLDWVAGQFILAQRMSSMEAVAQRR